MLDEDPFREEYVPMDRWIIFSLVVVLVLGTAASNSEQSPFAGLDPDALYRIGAEAFFQGDVERSCEAFDTLIDRVPAQKPRLWQRGISLYYANRLGDCVDQFTSHRTHNPHDAENSVWHYLCLAELEGHDAARKQFFPARDTRIPMMAIHRLFAGKGSPEEVFARVASDDPGGKERRVREFYANLYVALWFESQDQGERATEHLDRALDGPAVGHYMEIVARVHLERLRAGKHWAAKN